MGYRFRDQGDHFPALQTDEAAVEAVAARQRGDDGVEVESGAQPWTLVPHSSLKRLPSTNDGIGPGVSITSTGLPSASTRT
jgi:hypothetical protein